jgi:hypothetical protein
MVAFALVLNLAAGFRDGEGELVLSYGGHDLNVAVVPWVPLVGTKWLRLNTVRRLDVIGREPIRFG